MSCATCHIQSRGFECGIDHPKYTGGEPFGVTGISTPHAMMPLVNLVFNSNGYLWNGIIHETNTSLYEDNAKYHKQNIESLVWMGIVAPHEMNGDIDKTVDLIASISMYPPMFEGAFGTKEVTYERISKAIAQFIRTLISADSKFDKYMRGEYQMTSSELNGFVLFVTEEGADCFHCHGGDGNPLFTTNLYYNNATDDVFGDTRDRYAVTGNPSDIGAYRAPTLRNIFSTAPYMRDGRFSTIDEVIDFYSHNLVWSPYVHPLMHKISEGGAQLLPSEKNDLKNFLYTLQDTTFLTNEKFSNPRPNDTFFQSDPH
jgi:cytochrome c peroxidase